MSEEEKNAKKEEERKKKSEELKKRHPDVNPFLLRKWERIFNAFFDRNAGGDVDWGDFYLVVRQVRDIYGAESDQMQFAKNSMKALWEGLLKVADQDKNEVISVDEWVNVLKTTNPKNEAKWFHDYMTYMFKLFDVSGDNVLDLAEYTDGMLAYGFTTEEAHAAFKKFAVDQKGAKCVKIDFAKFKDYWNQYFYGIDPKSLGNFLFGPFPELEEAK